MLWLMILSLVLAALIACIPTSSDRPRPSSRRQRDLDLAHGPESLF